MKIRNKPRAFCVVMFALLVILILWVFLTPSPALATDYQDTLQVTKSTVFRQNYSTTINYGAWQYMAIGRNYDNYVQLLDASFDSLVAAHAGRTWDSVVVEGYCFTHTMAAGDSSAVVAYEMLVDWQEGYGTGNDTCGADAVHRYDLGWSTCTGNDTNWTYQGADGGNTDRSALTISINGNHGSDTTVLKAATLSTSAYNRIVAINGSAIADGMVYGFGVYNRRTWGDDEAFARFYSENNGTNKPRMIVYSNATPVGTTTAEAAIKIGVKQ